MKFRLYNPGDEEEIVRLLEICFDGWPEKDLDSKVDFWRWKYLDNPLKSSIVVVGLDDDNIMSCEHGIQTNGKVGSKSFLINLGSDLCVHPEYRGRGIRHKLYEVRDIEREKKGVAFHCSTTNNPIIIRGQLKRNRPQFPHQFIELVKIQDIQKHLDETNTTGSWFKMPIVEIMKLINKVTKQSEEKVENMVIKKIDFFDENIDGFYRKIRDNYHFIVERSKEYLNWRFSDIRGGKFIKFIAEENGEIQGYIVLRINRFNAEYPIGWIADLIVLQGRIDVAKTLVRTAVEFFDAENVNVVRYWVVKGHPFENVVKEQGFLDIRKSAPHIGMMNLSVSENFSEFMASKPEQLHFQAADTEYI